MMVFKTLDSCDLGMYNEDYLVGRDGRILIIRYVSHNHLTEVI